MVQVWGEGSRQKQAVLTLYGSINHVLEGGAHGRGRLSSEVLCWNSEEHRVLSETAQCCMLLAWL